MNNSETNQSEQLHENAVSKSLIEIPNFIGGYSTRKLHSSVNHKCTCKKPDSVKDGGYCYAKNSSGDLVRPCDIGLSLNYIANNADIKG
jgi:hypothetical protein